MILTIKDETISGELINEIQVELKSEITTVEEIISSRVKKEVELYNNKATEVYNGLVKPKHKEETLNNYKSKKRPVVDAEKQVYIALDAFLKNGFFVLIDNVQVESLNQEVHLRNDTHVSFIKLTPLVGG